MPSFKTIRQFVYVLSFAFLVKCRHFILEKPDLIKNVEIPFIIKLGTAINRKKMHRLKNY